MAKFDLKLIPTKPGIYIYRDGKGEVLYVGKAKHLKKRVSSYFLNRKNQDRKTAELVPLIEDIETVIVPNEVEALILENEYIKKYKPPFNVLMRDDKGYLYIKVTIQKEFPRIELVRKIAKDGAKYFGPYVDSRPVYAVMNAIKRIFPICSSNTEITSEKLEKKRIRACLNYHMGICPGVCIGKVSSEEYKKTFHDIIKFLSGKYDEVIEDLHRQMEELAARKKFEQAGKLRDAISGVKKLSEKQLVVTTDISVNEDVIGIARELNRVIIVLMQIRSGKLWHQNVIAMESKYESTDEEILSSFIIDYYQVTANFPRSVIIPAEIEDSSVLSKWLSLIADRRVDIYMPKIGRGRKLVDLARANANHQLFDLASKLHLQKQGTKEGLAQLAAILKMKEINRIEAYDISNTQGTDSVGSMVVFEDGQLNKSQYRRFKIKTVSGPNDYASLAEVIKRRLARSEDAQFAKKPDVILIDGGKGQVNTVAKILEGVDVRIMGVAKGDHSAPKAKDDIVLPFAKDIIVLPDNAPAKYLIQIIRDEAHRFAIALHSHLARKRMTQSKLEEVGGIGPATRKKLIRHFGSMKAVLEASEEEVAKIVGVAKAKLVKAAK